MVVTATKGHMYHTRAAKVDTNFALLVIHVYKCTCIHIQGLFLEKSMYAYKRFVRIKKRNRMPVPLLIIASWAQLFKINDVIS